MLRVASPIWIQMQRIRLELTLGEPEGFLTPLP